MIGDEGRLADVRIKTNGTWGEVYIDGHKIPNIIRYKIEHGTQENQVPVLKLEVQCNLDIETQICPELPEPWSKFYKRDEKWNITDQ